MPSLTPEQRRKAKEKLARDRGIGVESVTDQSVDLAIAAGNILLSDIASSGGSDVGYSGWSSMDTSGSASGVPDSSGGGCD